MNRIKVMDYAESDDRIIDGTALFLALHLHSFTLATVSKIAKAWLPHLPSTSPPSTPPPSVLPPSGHYSRSEVTLCHFRDSLCVEATLLHLHH